MDTGLATPAMGKEIPGMASRGIKPGTTGRLQWATLPATNLLIGPIPSVPKSLHVKSLQPDDSTSTPAALLALDLFPVNSQNLTAASLAQHHLHAQLIAPTTNRLYQR